MKDQGANTQLVDSRWNWFYRVSGAASVITGTLLLIAIPSLIITVFQPGNTSPWLWAFQNNWLIVIFKLHAGFSGVQIGLLKGLDLLDIAILAFESILHLGLYATLWKTSKVWSIIAAIQPLLGIVLFIATKNAGRSAVMGATLVISLVMLRSHIFKKAVAYLGILASVVLLIGDFSAGIPASVIIAALFGIAYILFITWLFLIAQRLFEMGAGA